MWSFSSFAIGCVLIYIFTWSLLSYWKPLFIANVHIILTAPSVGGVCSMLIRWWTWSSKRTIGCVLSQIIWFVPYIHRSNPIHWYTHVWGFSYLASGCVISAIISFHSLFYTDGSIRGWALYIHSMLIRGQTWRSNAIGCVLFTVISFCTMFTDGSIRPFYCTVANSNRPRDEVTSIGWTVIHTTYNPVYALAGAPYILSVQLPQTFSPLKPWGIYYWGLMVPSRPLLYWLNLTIIEP